MAFFLYASFPNSRIKPRPATVDANTYQITTNTLTLTLLAEENLNRTYILVNNLDAGSSFYYVYADRTLVDPMIVPVYGVKYQLIYDDVGQILYQKQDEGTNTNWVVIADPRTVGERILPLQSAGLESLENIWAIGDTAAVVVDIDEGRG